MRVIFNLRPASTGDHHIGYSRRFSSTVFWLLLLAPIYLAFPLSGLSQEKIEINTQNSLQFRVGINQIREENLHSKVHSGALFELSYGHYKIKRNLSQFNLIMQYSRLKTKIEDLSASLNIQIAGSYNYLFEVIKNEKFNFYAGPGINLHYELSLYPNWDESHLYWADYLSINMVNKLIYKLTENHSIVCDLSIPIFSVMSRPLLNRDYKIDNISFEGIIRNMHSNPKAAFWNKCFYLLTGMEYQFKINNNLTESICYNFNYGRLKSKNGLPFQNTKHTIGFKISF